MKPQELKPIQETVKPEFERKVMRMGKNYYIPLPQFIRNSFGIDENYEVTVVIKSKKECGVAVFDLGWVFSRLHSVLGGLP